MATAKEILQTVGRNFLQGGGLNRAIRVASKGKYRDMGSVYYQMLVDLEPYFKGSKGTGLTDEARIRKALKEVCGIDLTNKDTGSVFGLDAGSGVEKRADSVIADTPPGKNPWPDGKTTIKGLKISAPAKNKLTKVQQQVVQAIYNRWSTGALTAMEQALGVSFATSSKNLASRAIQISFDAPKGDTSAMTYWNHQMMYAAERGGKLYLYVNLNNRTIQDWTNGTVYNKKTGKNEEYMDRMLAREYSRIFLDQVKSKGLYDYVNLTNMRALYELVGGADDTLAKQIKSEVQYLGKTNLERMWGDVQSQYDNFQITNSPNDAQAARSYLAWRYFLKKSTEFINKNQAASSLVWSADGRTVTIGKNYKGTLDMSLPSVVVGYDPKRVKLILSEYQVNQLKGQADVRDYVFAQDGKEVIRFKNVLGKRLDFYPSANSTKSTYWVVPSKPSIPIGTAYGDKAETMLGTSNKNFQGEVDGRLYTQVRMIDMRRSQKATKIYGNAAANTIYASQGGSTLYGLGGDDKLYGGNGSDTFYYKNGDGNDTIYNFDFKKDYLQLGSGSLGTARAAGNDVILTVGKGSIRIKNVAGQTIRVKDASGKKVTSKVLKNLALPQGAAYAANNTKVNLSASFSGLFDARVHKTTIQNVDASKTKNKVIIYGNSKKNTLIAGQGGSEIHGGGGDDIMVGGNGADQFYYGKNDGNVTVKNFDAKNDRLVLSDNTDSKSYGGDSKTKTFWYSLGNGKKVTIAGGFGKWINITYANGQKNSLKVWECGVSDYNKKTTTLSASYSGKYQSSGDTTVDASKSRMSTTILGTAADNTIKASQGGCCIDAGKGKNTIVCGRGSDVIHLYNNYGQNVISGLQKNDILYLNDVLSIKDVNGDLDKKKGVLTLRVKNGSVKAVVMGMNANTSFQIVCGKERNTRPHIATYEGLR